ncbi:MAG: site-2 protease family protein, partial [Candidatus Micrarchaeota archaeon]
MKKKAAEKNQKTAQNDKRPLSTIEKFALVIAIIIGVAAFFLSATSMLDNWVKAPLILAILFGAGKTISYIGRLENYYGIIILRGEKGFSAMRYFSKHPKLMRALADFGLSLGFGMIYSFLIFRKNLPKFFAHLLIVAGIFWILLAGSNMTVFGDDLKNYVLPAIGVLGGLLAFGISALAIQALNILTVPGTSPGAALVVPGITVPFWEGLIAIVIAATVHEIAHGVLAMVEKLEVKNSGAIFFGILPIGAFVEPNEKKLAKLDIQKKRRILIAGTTSNFMVFVIMAIIAFMWAPLVMGFAGGVKVTGFGADSASKGILREGEIVTAVNGVKFSSLDEFRKLMDGKKEGEVVALTTNYGTPEITLGEEGKLGILLETYFPANDLGVAAMLFISSTLYLILLINFALAVINLVPLFLTDG